LRTNFDSVFGVACVWRDACYLGRVVVANTGYFDRLGRIQNRHEVQSTRGVVPDYLDFVAVDGEHVVRQKLAVYVVSFLVDVLVDIAAGVRHAFNDDFYVLNQAAQFASRGEAEGNRVLFVVVYFGCRIEGAAYVGVDGVVAIAYRKAVAELVGYLIVVLADVVEQVFETAGKTTARFESDAHIFNRQSLVVVGARHVGSFPIFKIVGVEFNPDTVKDRVKDLENCHYWHPCNAAFFRPHC